MGWIRSLAKGLAVVACMLFFVHCGGEIEAPETGETPQVSQPAPRARVLLSAAAMGAAGNG